MAKSWATFCCPGCYKENQIKVLRNLGIMKNFDVNADALILRFEYGNQDYELEVSSLPVPNMMAESISGSENSDSEEFEYEDGLKFRVVTYKNSVEGNVEVFEDSSNDEIIDFEINEIYNKDVDY